MRCETGFVENVLKAFKSITREIEKGSSEHDVRYRFVKYFAEEVLGYEPKYIKWDKKRTDLTIVDENDFTLDSNGYFFVLGTAEVYGIVPQEDLGIKYLLSILNPKLTEYFLKKICPIKQGGYFKYSTKFLEQLPIKFPKTAEEKKIANQIIKKVDAILELHKSGIIDIDSVLEGGETEKLHQLPKVAFSISDNAKFEKIRVDENKLFVNSRDFLEIKDKKIKDFVEVYLNSNSEKLAEAKDVKNIILNIPVPKSDEVLKEIVKKGGADQLQIKEKIRKLENEINEMVYQIYGITQPEKRIIEAGM